MVTKRELEWVKFWATWMSRYKILAMEWNPQIERLSVTTKKWKLVANAAYLIWHTYIVYFDVVRLRAAMNPVGTQVGMILKALFGVLLLTDMGTYLMHVAFALSRNDLANLLNQLLVFNTKPGRETKPGKRQSIITFLQTFFLVALVCVVNFLVVAEYVCFSRENMAWTLFGFMKIIVHSIGNSTAVGVVFGLMQMYLIIFFSTVFDTLPSQDHLDQENDREEPDFLQGVLADYRSLAIISISFNHAYCRFVVPTVKYAVGVTGLSFFYMAIRSEGTGVRLASAFIGCYVLAAVMVGASAMSSLWMVSSKFLVKLDQHCRGFQGNQTTRKLLMSNVKSLVPLRLYVGGLYYMEGEAKLTFMQFLIFALVNMLLLK